MVVLVVDIVDFVFLLVFFLVILFMNFWIVVRWIFFKLEFLLKLFCICVEEIFGLLGDVLLGFEICRIEEEKLLLFLGIELDVDFGLWLKLEFDGLLEDKFIRDWFGDLNLFLGFLLDFSILFLFFCFRVLDFLLKRFFIGFICFEEVFFKLEIVRKFFEEWFSLFMFFNWIFL